MNSIFEKSHGRYEFHTIEALCDKYCGIDPIHWRKISWCTCPRPTSSYYTVILKVTSSLAYEKKWSNYSFIYSRINWNLRRKNSICNHSTLHIFAWKGHNKGDQFTNDAVCRWWDPTRWPCDAPNSYKLKRGATTWEWMRTWKAS